MSAMLRRFARPGVLLATLALAVVACFEEPTSPALCPEFCPGARLVTVESLLSTAVERDSSFQGYLAAHQGQELLAASLAGLESRPIFEMLPVPPRLRLGTGTDTTTGPIVIDSMRLLITVLQRSAVPRNLRLAFYQLPLGIDSSSTFAGLAPAFGAAPLRTVNVDSLLALPAKFDSVTGDTVLNVDSLRHAVQLRLTFDAAHAPFSAPDSGRLALGVRMSADSIPVAALTSVRSGVPATVSWFYQIDSSGVLIKPGTLQAGVRFDGFVSDAPPVTLDSNLIVGGVPSIRTLLRIALPRGLRDSTQIIRATLLLVPTATAPLTTPDSVFIQVRRVATDLGAKSPVAAENLAGNSVPFRGAPTDTLRIEMTNLFRTWQTDTTAVTAVVMNLLTLERSDSVSVRGSEAATFNTVRFFSSRTPALRPSILLTYVPRVTFGVP
jgi:hypothetical protein